MSTDLFIENYTMMSAYGNYGDLLLVVQVDSMPDDTFACFTVPQMTHHNCAGAKGRLYFAKSRQGNSNMWRDVFLNYVIPTVAAYRAEHSSQVSY